jgi:hypothetical protein
MGDNLCLLSLFASVPDQIELYVDNGNSTLENLINFQTVLNIPEDQIKIIPTTTKGNFNNYGWPLKLFSPYFQAPKLTIRGQDLALDGHNKGYIGLVCYNGAGEYLDKDRNIMCWDHSELENRGNATNLWPWCRYRPIDYYARVFEYCKTHYYDVITLESSTTTFEEKLEFMVRHCRAIIGFEGGIAHLAHTVGIPYFMLDWNLPSTSTTNDDYHCEMVHQSPFMYLLKDEELFSWSRKEFDEKINQVSQGKGNNRFVNGDCKIRISNMNTLILDSQDRVLKTLRKISFGNDVTGQFLKKYYQNSIII